MTIACCVAMTIRTKKDAEKWLKSFTGTLYLNVGDEDMEIHYEAGKKEHFVGFRPVSMRGNIFNPYFGSQDPIGDIYKYRKYINAWNNRKY